VRPGFSRKKELITKNWISDSISERIWGRWNRIYSIEDIFPQLKAADRIYWSDIMSCTAAFTSFFSAHLSAYRKLRNYQARSIRQHSASGRFTGGSHATWRLGKFALPNPISYCLLKHVNIYVFQRFKLNAIAAHARLAYLFSVRPG
jgi:hypothetical protein